MACQICTAEAQAAHPHQGSSPSQELGEALTSGSQEKVASPFGAPTQQIPKRKPQVVVCLCAPTPAWSESLWAWRAPALPAPNQGISRRDVVVVGRLLGSLGTRAARVELAISTLKNDVEGPRVAEVAVPHNQGAIRLDHLERVCAVTLDGHREAKGWWRASKGLRTSRPGKRLVGRGRQRASGRGYGGSSTWKGGRRWSSEIVSLMGGDALGPGQITVAPVRRGFGQGKPDYFSYPSPGCFLRWVTPANTTLIAPDG